MNDPMQPPSEPNDFYARIIECIDGIIWEANATTTQMTYVSPAAERLLGYPVASWLEPHFWIEHVHPEDREWVADYCRQETLAGRSHDFQYRMLASDGSAVWFRDIVTIVEEASGTILRGVMVNISDAKRAEIEAQERVRFLECMDRVGTIIQQAIDIDQMLSQVLTLVLHTFDCERAWLIHPCDPTAATWRAVFEQCTPNYPGAFDVGIEFSIDEPMTHVMQEVLDSDDPLSYELDGPRQMPKRLREQFGVKSQLCMALRPKIGAPYLFGIHQCRQARQWSTGDRHLLKQIGHRIADALTAAHIMRKLRDSELRFRSLFDHAIDAIFIHAEDGAIIDVNQKACDSLGFTKQELMGKTVDFFDPDFDPVKFQPLFEILLRGEMVHFESQHRSKSGHVFPVEIWVKCFWLGSTRLCIAQARDISDRWQLEEQFRQSQKMEAIGRLAGGLAHDFNNFLTVIGGYCELILASESTDKISLGFVAEIKNANDRAATLTQQILAFSRRKLLLPQVVDVNLRLRELHSLLVRLIGEDIDLAIVSDAGNAHARIDQGQFDQAIVNLVVNSRDAMPDGGRIHIRTRNYAAVDSTRFQLEFTQLPTNHLIEIAVSDDGCGMDDATRSRIFEPFFTTKEQGKGTGLGLAMVYGFVQQSEGRIEVDSKLGEGTTIRIYLPVVEGEVAIAQAAPASKVGTLGSETILLVEDESAVRELTATTLRNYGYQVLAAKDGLDGLSVAQSFEGKIDLLLSDLVMPNMNGGILAERLLAIRPDVKVLFMSGYVDHRSDTQFFNLTDFGYCQKPFTPQGLLRKIREVLSGSRI